MGLLRVFRGGAEGVQKVEDAPESSKAVSAGLNGGTVTIVFGAWVGLGGVVVGLRVGLGFLLGASVGLQLGVCVSTGVGVKYVAKLAFANKLVVLPLGFKILTPHRQVPPFFPFLVCQVQSSHPKLTLLPNNWQCGSSFVPLVASVRWCGQRWVHVTLV